MPWIFLSYLVLQACISFVVFQTKVAHLCVCLVRIKMPLLIWNERSWWHDHKRTLVNANGRDHIGCERRGSYSAKGRVFAF